MTSCYNSIPAPGNNEVVVSTPVLRTHVVCDPKIVMPQQAIITRNDGDFTKQCTQLIRDTMCDVFQTVRDTKDADVSDAVAWHTAEWQKIDLAMKKRKADLDVALREKKLTIESKYNDDLEDRKRVCSAQVHEIINLMLATNVNHYAENAFVSKNVMFVDEGWFANMRNAFWSLIK